MRFRILLSIALALGAALFFVAQTPQTHAAGLPSPTIERLTSHGIVTYTMTGTFNADGTVHQFRFNINCANGKPGCYVLITVSGKTIAYKDLPSKLRATVSPNVTDKWYSDSYKTCTGWFGSCGDYTLSQLNSYDSYDGTRATAFEDDQYCGASNWSCVGIGPTKDDYNQCNGCVENIYGPQLFKSSVNNNEQTKYAKILVHPNGSYNIYNTCAGQLC